MDIGSEWISVAMAVAGAMAGVLILLIKVVGDYFVKRIDRKLELKGLTDEVNRLTGFASQARSFDIMDFDSKVDAVVESVLDYSMRKGLTVNKTEIQLMVEASFISLKSLENTGLKLYQLKMENKNGKTIKE